MSATHLPGSTDPHITAHGARLRIDLGALAGNWQLLQARVGGTHCAAVIKADAYGLGIERAGPALARAGCATFFVAHLSEAARLRSVAPYAVIYVLNGLPAGAIPAYRSLNVRPVLGEPAEVGAWKSAGGGACALHVDTGMNRLGLPPATFASLVEAGAMAGLGIELLMSHFVAAEDPGATISREQIAQFAALRASLPGVPASLANSSGIFLGAQTFHDMVRPGYALYGGNPTPERANPMQPVVELSAPIIQLRSVEAGETVGYNSGWTARRRSRIATISVGYADGWLRALSADDRKPPEQAGAAVVEGQVCPFAGRVSMDLITLDVSDLPAQTVSVGTLAHLIHPDLPIDAVGARGGSIGYEVLTALGRRYDRHYIGG